MSFQIDPTKHLGDEIVRLAHATIGEGIATVGTPGESLENRVHVARTTCKKARALLRLLRRHHPGFFRRENRRLQAAAHDLSGLRDVEAMVSTARALRPTTCASQSARRALLRRLSAHRRSALADRKLVEERLAHFRRELRCSLRSVSAWKPRDRGFASMRREIRQCYRRARRAQARVDPHQPGVKYHEWRKAVKTFGYQCRLLRAAWPAVAKKYSAEVECLGHLLGLEHDLTMLADHITHDATGAPAASDRILLRLIAREQEILRAQSLEKGAAIFAEKPRAYCARLQAWWTCAKRNTRGNSKCPTPNKSQE
ncbi:MAG TPA: CHAD domain-containing protein [Candidatus Didemnitutus sp.]|nr:CHAD domain-containing protein [Candidatus Didemnitutus sp.]